MRFWLLVTGTGRCGTGYVSKVLTSVGVNCTHEGLFQPRSWEETRQEVLARIRNPHWEWQAESAWLAFPFLEEPELGDLTVVQLVRHPKRVIDSKCRMRFWDGAKYRKYANWAREYLPGLDEWPRIQDKAAYWYLTVNRIITRRAVYFHRVEDPVERLLDKLGIEYGAGTLFDDRAYNSRLGLVESDLGLGDFDPVLARELAALSSRWGYEWPDD